MSPSLAQLRAAAAAFGLDATGAYAALHARLGAHLVDRLLATTSAAPSTSSSEDEAPAQRRREKRPLSESAARWHAFAKRERPLVKQAGITDNVAILKEIASRYKRAKLVGTPHEPPLLMEAAPAAAEAMVKAEASDGIAWALAELPYDQIAAALAAHGLAPADDRDADIAALADALA